MLWPVDPRCWVWLRWLGACVLLPLLLAACGGGGSKTTSSPAHQQTQASGTTKAPAPKPVRLTVEVNGDLLIHSPVWEQALVDGHGHYDFYPMLREIAPYIRHADLAICHVETPMTPRPPHRLSGVQHAARARAAIKKTGWRICDTASNHSVDQGQYGIDQTGRALDRAGVAAHRIIRLPRGAAADR